MRRQTEQNSRLADYLVPVIVWSEETTLRATRRS